MAADIIDKASGSFIELCIALGIGRTHQQAPLRGDVQTGPAAPVDLSEQGGGVMGKVTVAASDLYRVVGTGEVATQ